MLSYKYEQETSILKAILKEDFEDKINLKKKDVKYIISPECMIYLTIAEIKNYIKLNDIMYRNEISDEMRNFIDYG